MFTQHVVTADQRVPIRSQTHLDPSHIVLNKCRATPLSGFQHDDSYRSPGEPVFFEDGENFSLASVENKGGESIVVLGFDAHAGRAPVFEVVATAEYAPLEVACRNSILRVVEHSAGNASRRQAVDGSNDFDSVAMRADTSDGIISVVERGKATIVFGNNFFYAEFGITGCHDLINL